MFFDDWKKSGPWLAIAVGASLFLLAWLALLIFVIGVRAGHYSF